LSKQKDLIDSILQVLFNILSYDLEGLV